MADLCAEGSLFAKIQKEQEQEHMQERGPKEGVPHVNVIICHMGRHKQSCLK